MRISDIKIGEYYRLKYSPDYVYIKVIKIYKPREYKEEYNFYLVECEHVINKSDKIGFIRYVKAKNIVRDKKE